MRERIVLVAPSASARQTKLGGTPFVAGKRYTVWSKSRDTGSPVEGAVDETDVAEHDTLFRIAATPLMLTATPEWRVEARGSALWDIVRIQRITAKTSAKTTYLNIYARRRSGGGV